MGARNAGICRGNVIGPFAENAVTVDPSDAAVDELAAGQRSAFVGWYHFVEKRLKDLTELFTSLLPIRQRWHGILHK